jgi:surfactin synthase thioesterase subunit
MNQVKATIIYGSDSNLFWKSDANWWKRNYPNFNIIPFDGGHLFPLELPEETAAVVKQILNR